MNGWTLISEIEVNADVDGTWQIFSITWWELRIKRGNEKEFVSFHFWQQTRGNDFIVQVESNRCRNILYLQRSIGFLRCNSCHVALLSRREQRSLLMFHLLIEVLCSKKAETLIAICHRTCEAEAKDRRLNSYFSCHAGEPSWHFCLSRSTEGKDYIFSQGNSALIHHRLSRLFEFHSRMNGKSPFVF